MNVVKLGLGSFARFGIESRLGSNVRVGVLLALRHYSRRLRSGWRPVAPPRFCSHRQEDEGTMTIELQLDPESHLRLQRVAEMYDVPLEHVLLHAVFVYLADLDAQKKECLA